LIGLAAEKPYGAIAVKEILDRANVGKSTFYTHFRDKDELLLSGIHEILRTRESCGDAVSSVEQVLAFSLPFLEYVDQHRRATGRRMVHRSHTALHGHLQHVLTMVLADDLTTLQQRSARAMFSLPTTLVARHIASTFVLVLDWWVETEVDLTPNEVNARFRALVLPTLAGRD
jgi:AcrR family transcriptional regulator